MVKAVLKVQILSSKPSDSMEKNIPLQKDEIFVDLKSMKSSVKRKIKRIPSFLLKLQQISRERKSMGMMLITTLLFINKIRSKVQKTNTIKRRFYLRIGSRNEFSFF